MLGKPTMTESEVGKERRIGMGRGGWEVGGRGTQQRFSFEVWDWRPNQTTGTSECQNGPS